MKCLSNIHITIRKKMIMIFTNAYFVLTLEIPLSMELRKHQEECISAIKSHFQWLENVH